MTIWTIIPWSILSYLRLYFQIDLKMNHFGDKLVNTKKIYLRVIFFTIRTERHADAVTAVFRPLCLCKSWLQFPTQSTRFYIVVFTEWLKEKR